MATKAANLSSAFDFLLPINVFTCSLFVAKQNGTINTTPPFTIFIVYPSVELVWLCFTLQEVG